MSQNSLCYDIQRESTYHIVQTDAPTFKDYLPRKSIHEGKPELKGVGHVLLMLT